MAVVLIFKTTIIGSGHHARAVITHDVSVDIVGSMTLILVLTDAEGKWDFMGVGSLNGVAFALLVVNPGTRPEGVLG